MAEYIDREKMLKCLEENNTDVDWIVGKYNADWIYSFIETQPTADVTEVKHGEWIPCGDGEHTPLMCSSCFNTWGFYKQKGSVYCPNCGAKMDGDLNDL